MMKLAYAITLIVSWSLRSSADAKSISTVAPPRMTYQDILNLNADNRQYLQSVLQEIGLISVTDIPMFAREKPETLKALPACVDALLKVEQQATAAVHKFPDGTTRKTLAVANSAPLELLETEACLPFQHNNAAFRDTVAEVTRSFGHAIQTILNTTTPLLWDESGTTSFDFQEIVAYGHSLEHFHVYERDDASDSDRDNHHESADSSTRVPTLDWHTDQGLMLVFTPGLVDGQPSQGDFFIQSNNGVAVPLEFSIKDELVIMLGEGVNQCVNPDDKSTIKLRPVPHQLINTAKERVWYGRMVLPPSHAIHPVQQKSFGALRQEMIMAGSTKQHQGSSSFSCSSHADHNPARSPDRHLQDITEDSCSPETQHFCWHRCMNLTDFPEVANCTSDEDVACANTARELWTGDHDPDFTLQCIDLSSAVNASTLEPAPAPVEDNGDEDTHDHAEGDDDHGHDHDGEDKEETSGSVALSSSWKSSIWGYLMLGLCLKQLLL